MSGCLGDVVAALVDGELDHAARERAQRHLAHCASCRAEVEDHRRLKARLRATPAVEPSDALTARLRALDTPDSAPVHPGPPVAGRPVPVRPVPRPASVRPAARPTGPAAPAGRPRRAAGLRRRAAAGSAVAALGVVAALALGAPPQRPGSTPVDPATDAFVTEFVSTANDGASGVLPASLTGASTAGSARSAR